MQYGLDFARELDLLTLARCRLELSSLSPCSYTNREKMNFLDAEGTDVSVCNDEGSSSGDESPTDNSSSDSESDSSISIPARPMAVSSKKARRRRLSYSDCEANSDGESRKKKKSAKHTHVTSHFVSRDRHERDHERAKDVLKEVRRSNKLLKTLVKRVSNTEKRLMVVEGTINKVSCTSCSSGIESTPTRSKRVKHDVPQVVRVSKPFIV